MLQIDRGVNYNPLMRSIFACFFEPSFLPRLAPEFNFTGGIPCKYSERLGFPPKISRGHRNEKIRGGHLDGHLGCDIGGAKELRVIYFPIIWGAKEPQNLPNHRVVIDFWVFFTFKTSGQRVSLTGWGYHFSVDVFFFATKTSKRTTLA